VCEQHPACALPGGLPEVARHLLIASPGWQITSITYSSGSGCSDSESGPRFPYTLGPTCGDPPLGLEKSQGPRQRCHVTSAQAIEKGKWLEWRDTPERTDSSGSNRPVIPDLDLDDEESLIVGHLVSADAIEHETDHALDYGDYGVISGHLVMS
jgi:hypothetical protein